MKCILLILAVLAIVIALPRTKRQTYELPDGALLLLGKELSTKFSCANLDTGYYADVDSGCQVFHFCHPVEHADGTQETLHYSFICGNQTVFSQLTMTCASKEEATPCQYAPQFYNLNIRIGLEDQHFLEEADVAKHHSLFRQ